MRKTILFACAAVLTSALALTSCNKEGQNEPKKPAEVVKTEFAISLPSQVSNGVKRMPGTTVQTTPAQFQGITHMVLVPFAREDGAIESTDARLDVNIPLTTDITSDGAGGTKTLGTKSKATVYSDVAIPMTTASFLFYGESKKEPSTPNAYEESGKLNATLTANTPADFTFDLQPIISPVGNADATVASLTGSGTKGEALIAYLNLVAQAKDGVEDIEWRNYTNEQSTAMTEMFATYKTLAALSSYQIKEMMTDLYKTLKTIDSPISTAIKNAIANATYATVDESGNVTLKSNVSDFPANIKLPDCAVRVTYDNSSKEFRALTRSEYTESNIAKPDLYVYPSSLWYYANSQIKTSNVSQTTNLSSDNYWKDILAGFTGATAVNSLTRSVAIKDTIQYGVARLDVTVKLKTSTLEDQEAAVVTPYGSGFPVSAVLVGNQKNVGFDFNPRGGAEAQTIYDSQMTNTVNAAYGSASAANSTLVLPTTIGAAATNDVMIAIELTNNTNQDFKGVGGQLIPQGAKFYLVARLAAASANVTANQVFKQDYTTTANLTIVSLANAYSTIPDLRTPQLELGMAVDLNWKEGNVYDDIEIP